MCAPQHVIEPHQQYTSRKPLALLGFVAVLGFPILLIVVLQRVSTGHASAVGRPVPQVFLKSAGPDSLPLADLANGKTAILFFSPACPHCQREIANFGRMERLFGDKIRFVAISSQNYLETREFLDSLHPGLQALSDADGRVRRAFGVLEVPAIFLVGANGIVERSYAGEQPFDKRTQQLLEFANQEIGDRANPRH